MPGGVVTGSPDLLPPPPAASTGGAFGTWARLGQGRYASTFAVFAYDAAGKAVGTLKFNSVYSLVGADRFEGESQVVACDLNLTCEPPTPGTARITGRRLGIEPVEE